jgi:ribokinase
VSASRILGPQRVAFIGALGEDPIAEQQISILRDEGVDFSGILIVPDEESGQAYITIDSNGANEIHTYFGANLALNKNHMRDRERLDLIKQSKYCVIMDPPLETAEALSSLCKEYNVKVIWDPGVYAEDQLENLIPILRNTDYFILNHLEYENLLGTSNPRKVIEILEKQVKGIAAIIKRGAEGSTLINGSGTTLTIEALPLEKLEMQVVNTVGCGDAFIGGFSASKVLERKDIEALRFANAAGGFKATRKETRGGPNIEQLNEILERWKQI